MIQHVYWNHYMHSETNAYSTKVKTLLNNMSNVHRLHSMCCYTG